MATMPTEVPIPFSEPPYLQGLPVPWITPGLREWQRKCRAFITEHLTQYAWDWEKEETVPEHLFPLFCKHNMLIPNLPSPLPVAELKAAGIHDILGVVKVEDFNYFHTLIYIDEMGRSGLAGPAGSLSAGFAFVLLNNIVPHVDRESTFSRVGSSIPVHMSARLLHDPRKGLDVLGLPWHIVKW